MTPEECSSGPSYQDSEFMVAAVIKSESDSAATSVARCGRLNRVLRP